MFDEDYNFCVSNLHNFSAIFNIAIKTKRGSDGAASKRSLLFVKGLFYDKTKKAEIFMVRYLRGVGGLKDNGLFPLSVTI